MNNLAKKSRTEPDFDAIVIGAGFGGIYMLHKLRNELGLKTRALEKGGGIGGTWYFNRYPGAKSDTEGFVYRYSFDKGLLQEWDWTTRYLEQSDIEKYLNHVVDRFDLRRNGFRFMFGTFCDIATNPEANAAAAAFIRSKIKEIVKDPETARKLTPTGLYAKRPLCNEGYYETFNRDNVTLVSIEENPIEAITPAGVRTADGVDHRLDVLVFATGFDAVDGNYRSMDLRGRGGRHINEGWAAGASSYLGVSTHGFPNLFMILGPNGPFTNLPPSIESQVDWISETIRHAERSGIATVEPSREAEDSWTKTCQEIADMTLFPKVESWIFGANIPGKKNTVMFYMAGIGAYRQQLEAVRNDGYKGFVFS